MPEIFSCKMEMQGWLKMMRRISATAVPNAVANSLNRIADNVRLGARHNMRQDFTLRNQYTENSMGVSYARPKENLSSYSMVGTRSKYLPAQEVGGTHHEAIATVAARGGTKAGIVPPRLRMRALTAAMMKGTQKGRRRSKTGKPFLMTLRRGTGIFQRIGQQLLMVRDLRKQDARIKATHWFSRAVQQFGSFAAMHRTFTKELEIQLKRIGLK